MKQSSIKFFQTVIVLIGISAFIFLLWEPTVEGRNVNSTLFEIYFKDPFLTYAYMSSILFFAILYQTFKLLGYVGQNEAISQSSIKALRTIKYCAIALVALIVGTEIYLFIAVRGKDDIAGGVAMGLFMLFIFVVIATTASVFERRLQTRMSLKP